MQNLRELKGQAVAQRILMRYLEVHPPPLLVLHGPEGTGRWSAAEAFVQQRLCEVGSGCGQCGACRKLIRGDHPDFIRFPEERTLIGDPDDPAEFTVRWLLRTRVIYTPFAGDMRFVLFPRADLIHNEAETALLKTLEDAPAHTRFVFLVRSIEELKPTIVSRSVLVPFRSLGASTLAELAGENSERELSVLGGSLKHLAMIKTPLFRELCEKLGQARQHPQALAELERWIKHGEKRGFGDLTGDVDFEFSELLEVVGTVLLADSAAHKERGSVAEAVFEFKAGLHEEQAGAVPYLLGRLFWRLSAAYFPRAG
ncbi:MAG: hypothetical protein H7A21_12295 [Spirochaetales bacterium]|nr:hypothetical protein [Leptospiraceae bacterium]MCP5482208.1 hypothetical protein [Spirochaetales bacterium]MCP5484680.1 hypothetical protein [Spirochaetales bacterium]